MLVGVYLSGVTHVSEVSHVSVAVVHEGCESWRCVLGVH